MREALLRVILVCLPLAFPFGSLALAQSQSLGSTMDMFIFPAQGQDSSQQSKDEAACYEWAVGNSWCRPVLTGEAGGGESAAGTGGDAGRSAGWPWRGCK